MPEIDDVPGWPVITIEMSGADIRVDGEPLEVAPDANPRAAALAAVAGTARRLGRPVRVEAVEEDGTIFPLIVTGEAEATEAGPPIQPTGGRWRRGKQGTSTTEQGRGKGRRTARRKDGGEAPAAEPSAHPEPNTHPEPAAVEAAVEAPAPFEPDERVESRVPEAPAEHVEAVDPVGIAWTPPRSAESEIPTPPPPTYAPAVVQEAQAVPEVVPGWQPDSLSRPAEPRRSPAPPVAEPISRPTPSTAEPVGQPRPLGQGFTETVPSPSAEQQAQLRKIQAALATGETSRALALADALDTSTAAAHGDESSILAAREVHAYAALRDGATEKAVELFAEAAAIRAQHDRLTGADGVASHNRWAWRLAQNAHYCWLNVADTEQAFALSAHVIGAYSAAGVKETPAALAARAHADELRRQLLTA